MTPTIDELFTVQDHAWADVYDRANGPSETRHLDRTGHPLTAGQWTVIIANHPEYVNVAQTVTGTGQVLTLWLGIVEEEESEVCLFETTVTEDGQETVRLCAQTEDEALANHARLVVEQD